MQPRAHSDLWWHDWVKQSREISDPTGQEVLQLSSANQPLRGSVTRVFFFLKLLDFCENMGKNVKWDEIV